ncbi:MAG: bifunctional precorrin-2 dehydrogenase/sirohydrochlorin ferrochelatase [Bulleidia sp.]
MAYFPFFMDLERKPVLVCGSGSIARSKIRILQDFNADITCISTGECPCEGVHFIHREVCAGDVEGMTAVIVATDDRAVNHRISLVCKEKGIPVNAVDQKEDCTFIFPSLIHENNIVAAFSSGGRNPEVTQYMKRQAKSFINSQLGEINEALGQIRDQLMNVPAETRKQILNGILEECLASESWQEVTEEYQKCISEQAQEDQNWPLPRRKAS